MIKILSSFVIILLLTIPATAANVTKVEIHGTAFDEKSGVYNTTLQWNAQTFTGFWYALGGGKESETLKIDQTASTLTVSSREIQADKLFYNTSRTDQKYKVFSEKGRLVENALDYNSTTKEFTKKTEGGYYARLGWFGDQYVAVNGKSNKLARLIKEQKAEEKKTVSLGALWDLGEGYNLTVQSIDTTTSPRQAWLSLNKDGKTLDNKVVNEGDVYTYIEKSVGGESDVPVFVTYVESIFSGAEGMANLVQLRYTWLISQNVLEVKAGDTFGVFEVKEANEKYLFLYNKDKSISLGQNTVQPLYGDVKIKVADSDTALRFFPILEKTKPGKYEVRGGAYDQSKYKSLTWDAQRFPGFWYALGGGKSSETLTINQSASSLTNTSRTIEKEKLLYRASRTEQKYKVFGEKGKLVENGFDYNSTTKTLTKNTEGGYYVRLGWFGEEYVALNGKANKLVKLVKEQKKDEKQTLTIGDTWNLGEGYSLAAQSIDAKASPRQAHLVFSKDGNKLDDKIVTEGQVYTYVAKSLNGESDVPLFVTYPESIFAGTSSDIVQLKYTWLISQNVTEIKTADKFGVFEVKEANEDHLLLYNKDNQISLTENQVVDLAGGIKFKVSDSTTALRFYPFIEQTIQAEPLAVLKAANAKLTPAITVTTPLPTPAITATSTPSATTPPVATQAAATTPPITPAETQAPATARTNVPAKPSENTPVPKQPGFEALYVITGLAATVYLMRRWKKN